MQDGWDPPSWKSTWLHFFSAEDGPIWIKFRRLVQNDMSTAVMWSKSKPDVVLQYGRRLGEFHGKSSQSHLPHCKVLPPGEFNVMIPELCVSHCRVLSLGEFTVSHDYRPTCHIAVCSHLAKSMSWLCHIASATLKIIFRNIFFFCFLKCSLGFDERRLSYRIWYTCFIQLLWAANSIWQAIL